MAEVQHTGSKVATSALFDPITIAGVPMRNRLMMAPMGTCLDEGGHITDADDRLLPPARRGGVGTITVEGCLVSAGDDRAGAEDQRPRVPARSASDSSTTLKADDVTVGIQLMHPGRQVVAGPMVAPVAGAAELARARAARADGRGDRPRSSPTTPMPPTARRRPASSSSRSTAHTATCRRTSSRRWSTSAPTPTAATSIVVRASSSRSPRRSERASTSRCSGG